MLWRARRRWLGGCGGGRHGGNNDARATATVVDSIVSSSSGRGGGRLLDGDSQWRIFGMSAENHNRFVTNGEEQQTPWYIREAAHGNLMRRELLVRWVATSGQRGVVALCAR